MILHRGLDLAGGAHLVYQADLSEIEGKEQSTAVEGVRDIIENRVNALGVSEPVVQTNKSGDNYRIIVEMPGITDVKEAIDRIGDTPVLEFKEQKKEFSEEEKKVREEYNKQAEVTAREILHKVKDATSEEFAELAAEYSEDPGSKDNGGDLSWAKPGMFVPEFEEVLFDKLQDGEFYPELVKTQFGYHIIKRIESRVVTDSSDIEEEIISSQEVQDQEEDQAEAEAEDEAGARPAATDEPASSADQIEVHGAHILIAAKPLTPEFEWENTELSGKQLDKARVVLDNQTGLPQVSLEFNSEGAKLFEEITERNVGDPVAIFLDGLAISIPRVNEKISGGSAVISGDFNLKEARDLAKRLNSGALPVPIELISQTRVGASLGQESIEKSFAAAIIGLLLLALFMIIYYRLPGFLAVIALSIYVIIIVALFKLIPVTLTLAGIAGFILSIGLAVDANVLIFERMKEELRAGKPLGSSIDEGFKRAWSSIRDSNVSSLITAFILIWFGTSMIKGFAITLSIGILVSMFSAIVITRTFLKLCAGIIKKDFLWG